MTFIDKAKEAAEQGLAQVQAKIDDLQAKRQHDALLRDLGSAYYAEKRSNGAAEAVNAALAAVDSHVADSASADRAAEEKPADSKAAHPPGGYGLDDL